MAHVDRIIRACSQNKALRGKRKYLNITTKIVEVPAICWLVCYLIADAAAAGLLPGLPERAHDVVQVRLGHVRHVVRQLQLVRHRVAVLARQRAHHRAAHPLQ